MPNESDSTLTFRLNSRVFYLSVEVILRLGYEDVFSEDNVGFLARMEEFECMRNRLKKQLAKYHKLTLKLFDHDAQVNLSCLVQLPMESKIHMRNGRYTNNFLV